MVVSQVVGSTSSSFDYNIPIAHKLEIPNHNEFSIIL